MKENKSPILYRALRGIVHCCYKEPQFQGLENIPQEPVIFVGNHAQMHGPIVSELYIPGEHETWCAGEMMHLKEVPAYAYEDFWSEKPRHSRWIFKLASYAIAPLASYIFNHANTIAVYHDARVVSTLKRTVQTLCEGASVVIFPEFRQYYNRILYQFQTRFIDVAKLYYKRCGKELAFVPMYLAPYLKTLCFGKPVYFSSSIPIEVERERIGRELMDQITRLAQDLPLHHVVPYRNMAKKDYPLSRDCPEGQEIKL